MKNTFKILFYIKKTATKSNGNAPIMARITLNGEIAQFSLKCEVNPDDWDGKAGKAMGRTQTVIKLNSLLDNFKASLIQRYRDICEREAVVTAEKVKNAFLGVQISGESLLELFQKHNDDVEAQIGKGKTSATLQKYNVTLTRLKNFMKYKYNISDISLKEVNHMFISDFEIYLKTVCDCNNNTTAKFMQFFKRIIIIAKNNGWIYADPFANYKIKLEKVDRTYLSQDELDRIMSKEFATKRLEQVRDIFIFSCYTGLAYIDVKNLTKTNIRKSFDENLWIMTKRQKTNIQANIPLLDLPQLLIQKYENQCMDSLLPVLSNQKMNNYLKEIADLCGIDKNLTFHMARHTFATTVTLSKGVSIESVSKMLGHTNIKTTQLYARITDSKVSEDMGMLSKKLRQSANQLAL